MPDQYDNFDLLLERVQDHYEAKVIRSFFENGLLTIQRPADGAGTVSGAVTSSTVIECDDDSTTATASHDGSDDNSGPGSADDDSSDDRSGPGDGTTTTTTTTTTTSGSDDGANHDVGDDHGDDDNERNCTSADLKPGARVHEAKLATNADGSKVFTKIELVPAA